MTSVNKSIIPIFSTQGSVGKSILTAEDEQDISQDSPVSIFGIAKKFNLKELLVINNSFLDFCQLYKNSKKNNIHLVFGLTFTICNDVKQKTKESLQSNCKVCVLMKNSKGYEDLIRLNNAINANESSFYYTTRGDWSILNKFITENLQVVIPPYDNFIHRNLFEDGDCLPNLEKLNPLFLFANMELPFDTELNLAIFKFIKNNNYPCLEVHPIYYYAYEDFKPYIVLRSIGNRSSFWKPENDFLCSPNFCWEDYNKKAQ